MIKKWTLEDAKKLVGQPLNEYEDTMTNKDVKTLENLKHFCMYLGSPFDPEPKIEGNKVVFAVAE